MLPSSISNLPWGRIGMYWLCAGLCTWAGDHLGRWLLPPGSWATGVIDTSILAGMGPLLAGWLVFRRIHTVSWVGTRPAKAWLMLGILPLAWVVAELAGLPVSTNLGASLLFTLSVIIYCAGEEWGWRGYLYEALLTLSPVWRVVITSVLWYGWHFVFYTDLYDPQFALSFLAMIVAGSFGLDAVVVRTRSVAAVTAFHALVKLGFPQFILLGVLMLLILATVRRDQKSLA